MPRVRGVSAEKAAFVEEFHRVVRRMADLRAEGHLVIILGL
jgi:hypothetical protein